MKNSGAKAGQIISIDAHNNGNNEEAIFSAWWNRSLPSTGDLNDMIKFQAKNDETSWIDHYIWASSFIGSQNGNINVHAMTSSCNECGRGVTYVFQEKDEVLDVLYSLDEGKISESKAKVIGTQTNKNNTDVDQTINFQYTESMGESASNTSEFSNEIGVSLTIGTEFSAGVPALAEGKISTELTASSSHTWGESKTISNDFSTSASATTNRARSRR